MRGRRQNAEDSASDPVEGNGRAMDDAKAKAAATYNAAADYFDDPALSFWDRFGRATVERLRLAPGASVLDACAGSGASALPAALRVGSDGRVVAADLAGNLLALAAEKARRAGISNLEIRHQDLESLDYPPESFDAVVIVFGIFFLPDMPAAAAGLWRMVRPGGQLAVTTWGPGVFEPASTIFWDAVADIRPDLRRAYNPWDQLTEPDAVRDLLFNAGAQNVDVEPVDGTHRLARPEDFWKIVLGTGYRATYDAMDDDERRRLKVQVLYEMVKANILEVGANVVYATASKH